MAGQGQAWWCYQCAKWCKAKATFCGDCGKRWDQQSPSWQQQTSYAGGPTQFAPRRGDPSPRRGDPPWQAPARPRSPRQRGHGKGKGKANEGPKGRGKQQPAVMAPSLDALPQVPAAPPPTLPRKQGVEPSGAAGSQPSSERAQLDALMAVLATTSGLPEAAQAMLTEYQKTNSRSTAKDLHKAVADQAKARQELAKIRGTRQAYLSSWKDYVTQVMDLLDEQVKAQVEVEDSDAMVTEAVEVETRLRREQEEQHKSTRQVLEALLKVKQQAEAQAKPEREGSRTPRRRGAEESTAEAEVPQGTATTPFKLGTQGVDSKDGRDTSKAFQPPQQAHK
eukprot:s1671_g9.t1